MSSQRLFLCLALLAATLGAQGQEVWTLRRMVDHAMQNNVSVRQADVQARINEIALRDARLAQLPNAGSNSQLGMQFGRSIDPTTNQFVTTQLLFNTFNINGGMQLYGFGALKENVRFNAFVVQASYADKAKAANDIALNVCNFYLQALASREQINIARVQIAQSQEQLDITRKRVNAGSLPELNAVQLEAQVANDSITYYNSLATYRQNLIALQALLNLDLSTPFAIDTPAVESIPVESLADLPAEYVYQLARNSQPQQKGDSLRLRAAMAGIRSSRAALYPTLSVGYSLGSNFSNPLQTIDFGNVQVTGARPTENFVVIGGQPVFVQQPTVQLSQRNRRFGEVWQGYWKQLDQNFRQSLGFQLNVPIFSNTGNVRNSIRRSQLNLSNQEFTQQRNLLQLQQDVYNAYNQAQRSMEQFYAGERNVFAAQKAYDYALKRYQAGLLPTLDLITTQNNLLRAKLQQLNNRYDYVFRMKLLEFFKGQGLRL